MNELRKILFTGLHKILVVTNATDEQIEDIMSGKICFENFHLEFIKRNCFAKTLINTFTDGMQNGICIDVIGYDKEFTM